MHILQLADLGPKWKKKIYSSSVNYRNLQATSCSKEIGFCFVFYLYQESGQ